MGETICGAPKLPGGDYGFAPPISSWRDEAACRAPASRGCGPPCCCTIAQRNWSRGDECNAAFSSVVNEEGRVDSCTDHHHHQHPPHHHHHHRDQDKHLPLDSQSAQNLFSSSASRELRTVWYLSTSFTDFPVIIAPVLLLHSPCAVRAGCSLLASYSTKLKQCV